MLKTLIAAAVLAAAPVAPALADHDGPTVTVELGIYGANDRDHGWGRHDRYDEISRRQAIRIAASYGVDEIYDVDRRDHVWVVTGSTWRGEYLEVKISAYSGRVLDVDDHDHDGWGDDRW